MLQVSQIAAGMSAVLAQNQNSLVANGKNNVYVGNDGVDVVANYTDDSQIFTGAGKDTVLNVACGVKINTGADDDAIVSIGSKNDINAGEGNNSAFIQGNENIFKSGSGDDFIAFNGNKNKINAGGGTNTIFVAGLNFTTDAFGFITMDSQNPLINPYLLQEVDENGCYNYQE